MDNTYLFFDIECANCFDGEGKMCSFGYVITDAGFNVLETQDIVMNPQAEFDWYLFSPKNRCPLAYSRDYFRHQHPFEDWYKSIKELLTAPYRKVIGFASPNDVGFVVTACRRYNLPVINFAAYDSEPVLDRINGEKKGLEAWNEFYHTDTSELKAHRSCDDAMMTMFAVKALCAAQKKDIETLLAENRDTLLSSEKAEEQMIARKHRKETEKKLDELYMKKCRNPKSQKLSGFYSLGFKTGRDIDEAYEIALMVYENGGMLVKRLKGEGTLILEDGEMKDEPRKNPGIQAVEKSAFRAALLNSAHL